MIKITKIQIYNMVSEDDLSTVNCFEEIKRILLKHNVGADIDYKAVIANKIHDVHVDIKLEG